MRKPTLSIIILLIIGLSKGTCGAEVIDKIVAVVNGEIITFSELARYRSKPQTGSEATLNPREEKAKILDRLIEEKLIDQQCRKRTIRVSARDIEEAIEDVKRRNAITEEQLKTALRADGLSWEDYQQELKKQIMRSKLISRVVREDFSLDDEAFKRFYVQHIKRFKEPNRIRVSHILIMIPQNADDLLAEALLHKGEMILERVRRGGDFGELARLYSDDASAKNGGDLGFFKKGELLPKLDRIVFTMQPGEFDGLVRTKIGFHIVKVTEKKEGQVIPYEEVMEKVKDQYIEEESERRFKGWLQKLKAESFIEVKL
jgi:peptidyl-prolyl cis-trans isomerase SurA